MLGLHCCSGFLLLQRGWAAFQLQCLVSSPGWLLLLWGTGSRIQRLQLLLGPACCVVVAPGSQATAQLLRLKGLLTPRHVGTFWLRGDPLVGAFSTTYSPRKSLFFIFFCLFVCFFFLGLRWKGLTILCWFDSTIFYKVYSSLIMWIICIWLFFFKLISNRGFLQIVEYSALSIH